jgi:hypothetical protein
MPNTLEFAFLSELSCIGKHMLGYQDNSQINRQEIDLNLSRGTTDFYIQYRIIGLPLLQL